MTGFNGGFMTYDFRFRLLPRLLFHVKMKL